MGDHHGARVVLATHNRGKLAELRDLLAAALPGIRNEWTRAMRCMTNRLEEHTSELQSH